MHHTGNSTDKIFGIGNIVILKSLRKPRKVGACRIKISNFIERREQSVVGKYVISILHCHRFLILLIRFPYFELSAPVIQVTMLPLMLYICKEVYNDFSTFGFT